MNDYLQNNLSRIDLEKYLTPQKSPPFNSSTPRVDPVKTNNNPGPGSYNIKSIDSEKTSKYHKLNDKSVGLRKQHQWIFDDQRSKVFHPYENNRFLGPGAYQIEIQRKSPQHSWSKSSRFKLENQQDQKPGPGSYNYSQKNKCPAAEAAFKSKIPKSIDDTIQYQKQREDPVSRVQAGLMSSATVDYEKEMYEKQEKSKAILKKSSNFASQVPRFLDLLDREGKVGPGSYNLILQKRQKYRKNLPRMIRLRVQKTTPELVSQKSSQVVGPGSYDNSFYEISKVIDKKGYAISRETRFNFRHLKNNSSSALPGPGHYNERKYQFVNEQSFLKTNHKRYKSSSLQTIKEGQQIQCVSGQNPVVGLYNVSNFDINYRLKKKLEHQQKLRLMEVSVPPFDSKVPRI